MPLVGLTLGCLRADYSGATVPGFRRLPPNDPVAVRAPPWAVKRIRMMSITLTLELPASTRAVREAAFPIDEPLDPQATPRQMRGRYASRRCSVDQSGSPGVTQ